jgi:adenylate kinase family enzyme
MCGLPGAGKTTVAHKIRHALGDAIVISRDNFKNPPRAQESLYENTERVARLVDNRFYYASGEYLSVYSTIIMDATFREYVKRQSAFVFARQQGCQLYVIECICSEPVLKQRLQRQIYLGEKKFRKPLQDVLEFYKKSMQEPGTIFDWTSFLRFDTEKNEVVDKYLQVSPDQFGKQLIEILEHSYGLSSFESFHKVYNQEKSCLIDLATGLA